MELFHPKVPIFCAVLYSWIEKIQRRMAVRVCHDELIATLGLQSIQVGIIKEKLTKRIKTDKEIKLKIKKKKLIFFQRSHLITLLSEID